MWYILIVIFLLVSLYVSYRFTLFIDRHLTALLESQDKLER